MLTEQQQAELLGGFGPWVAKQPANKSFDYVDNEQCAFAQYLRASGYDDAHCNSENYWLDTYSHQRRSHYHPRGYRIPPDLNEAIQNGAWTFGALAERLELAGWLNRAPQEDAGKPAHHLNASELTAGML